MTRETKVGLLVGMGIILLIGIVVSDHLSKGPNNPAMLTGLADSTRDSLSPRITDTSADPFGRITAPTAPVRTTPILMPQEIRSSTSTPSPATHAQQRNPQIVQANFNPRNRDSQPFSRSTPIVIDRSMPTAKPTPPMAARIMIGNASTGRPLIHYVKPGENLYQIASLYYGSSAYWQIIRQANRNIINANGQIRPGTKLKIPNQAGLLPPKSLQQLSNRNATQKSTQVTVQAGQTLSGIALRYLGSTKRWPELLAVNRDKIRSPQELQVGMTLRLPDASTSRRSIARPSLKTSRKQHLYTVQAGDTLSSIAIKKLGQASRWDDIYSANQRKIRNPDSLTVGMKLQMPR